MAEIDHHYTPDPVCPHCGEIYDNAWEWREDDGVVDCDKCEKQFVYSRIVTIEYTTEPKQEPQ